MPENTLDLTLEDVIAAGRVLFGPAFHAQGQGWRADLKTTYKRRALETHPDRARSMGRSETELSSEFRRVAEAYRVLSALAAGPLPTPAVGAVAPETPPRPPPRPRPAQPRPRPAEARTGPRPAPAPEPEPVRAAEPPPPPPGPGPGAPRARRPAAEAREAARQRAAAHAKAQAESAAAPQPDAAEQPAADPSVPPARDPASNIPGHRVRYSVHPDQLPHRKLRFAEYLYYSGRVPWTALVEAIAWQRSQRPPVGRIAVDWGFLSQDDVARLLEQRRVQAATGTPFGEYLVREGYLTSFQLLAVLGRQLRMQKRIGDFFVTRGWLEPDEIDEIRRRVSRHNARWKG